MSREDISKRVAVGWGIAVITLLTGCYSTAALDRRAQLQAAAEGGSAEAQYQLGQSYCCGFGAGHDSPSARTWFCRAALKGHAGAQYALGRMLGDRMDSDSTPSQRQNFIASYMWYSLAAQQGNALAAAEREAIKKDLKPQEQVEAERRMRDWQGRGC